VAGAPGECAALKRTSGTRLEGGRRALPAGGDAAHAEREAGGRGAHARGRTRPTCRPRGGPSPAALRRARAQPRLPWRHGPGHLACEASDDGARGKRGGRGRGVRAALRVARSPRVLVVMAAWLFHSDERR
jgi:hypothetical protein